MKIAAHIPFYFVEHRLLYLKTVIGNLEKLPHQVDIFVYSNCDLGRSIDSKNVKVKIYPYQKSKLLGYNNGIWNHLGLTRFVHPFFLTWENRKVVEGIVEQYDAQMYLEDDIGFTNENLEYWLQYKNICLDEGFNLGFLRVEYDEYQKVYLTDPPTVLFETIEIGQQKFVLNNVNPYCGFWIYDKNELTRFVKSKEWGFKFQGLQIREKSAIGWHGLMMERYKGTLLPMKQINGSVSLPKSCLVHHLPNTYISHPAHCKVKLKTIVDDYYEMQGS